MIVILLFYFSNMSLPHFFVKDLPQGEESLVLGEENSRYIVQVLRMKDGEKIWLLNGKGMKARAEILEAHKKHCTVSILEFYSEPRPATNITIAISLLKNVSRFEWFLEKATEIGVSKVVPLLCTRTETQKFRADRMQTIIQSAMLQSQRLWLPELSDPVKFEKYLEEKFTGSKFIAHCINEQERNSLAEIQAGDALILIGPEGDFTEQEIAFALQSNYGPVSLGAYRLRTETAGLVAAALLCRGI